jgi:cell division septal protein FtsQ
VSESRGGDGAGFRPRNEEIEIAPEVIAELAAVFAAGGQETEPDEEHELPVDDGDEGIDDALRRSDEEPELDPTEPVLKVIAISDDGLEDPMYLDEVQLGQVGLGTSSGSAPTVSSPSSLSPATSDSSDVSRPSGRVVIVDSGEDDAVVPDASGREGSGRMEPRLRARRISVRRAEGRRRLRWMAAVAGVLFFFVTILAVLGSPLFSINDDDVVVTGAVYTDQQRLQGIVDDAVGSTTLLLDTRGIERRIEEIPWVERARVRTSFPTGLRIEIRERTPLATYRGADGLFRVIDKEGRVLDVINGQPIAYMLVFGLESLNLESGQFTPPGPVGAAQLVQALTSTVRGRTQAIEVDPDGEELVMYLYRDALYATQDPEQDFPEQDPDFDPITAERIEVRFGAATELLLKLVRLETVLPVALTREVSLIDISTATVTVR